MNELITHPFEFEQSEELLAHYVSFLKTLSLKLNRNTIQFFFNEGAGYFPLYTEALKLFDNAEDMVRILMDFVFGP